MASFLFEAAAELARFEAAMPDEYLVFRDELIALRNHLEKVASTIENGVIAEGGD